MKRVLALLMSIAMLLCFVACGDDDGKKEEASNINQAENPEPSTAKVESNKETEAKPNSSLSYTFKVPGEPVVFDYPSMRVIEAGTSRVFEALDFMGVFSMEYVTAELEEIPQILSLNFDLATGACLTGEFEAIVVEKTERLEINGTEVLVFDGYVHSAYDTGEQLHLPMHGYAFVKGSVICQLLGVMHSQEDAKAEAEMIATIDAMINTLRESR